MPEGTIVAAETMDYKKVAAVAIGVAAVGLAAGLTYWIIKKRRANKTKEEPTEAVNPVTE